MLVTRKIIKTMSRINDKDMFKKIIHTCVYLKILILPKDFEEMSDMVIWYYTLKDIIDKGYESGSEMEITTDKSKNSIDRMARRILICRFMTGGRVTLTYNKNETHIVIHIAKHGMDELILRVEMENPQQNFEKIGVQSEVYCAMVKDMIQAIKSSDVYKQT